MNQTDALAVLNLNLDANQADLKKAYHSLAMSAHPDRGGNNQNMALINEAHKLLKRELPTTSAESKPPAPRHEFMIQGQNPLTDGNMVLKATAYSNQHSKKTIGQVLDSWLGTFSLHEFYDDMMSIINEHYYSGTAIYKGAQVFIHQPLGTNEPICSIRFKGNELQLFIK